MTALFFSAVLTAQRYFGNVLGNVIHNETAPKTTIF